MAAVVICFLFVHDDHPVIRNLTFSEAGSGNCPDGFLLFDGVPDGVGAHIGTHGQILGSSFSNGSCVNNNFVAINISPTSTSNYENFLVDNDAVICSSSKATLRSTDGVTNGTTTLTSTTAAFVSADVGKRIRISWAGASGLSNAALLDTVIDAVGTYAGGTTATLHVAPSWSQTGVTIITDGSHGIGVKVGDSFNTYNEEIHNVSYNSCAIGIDVLGGSAEIINPNSGYSDIGVQLGTSINRGTYISGYESEYDVVAINMLPAVQNVPITISNSDFQNLFQNANGSVMDGAVSLILTGDRFEQAPPTNGVLMGVNGTSTATVLSIGNYWQPYTWAKLGFNNFTSQPISIGDNYSGQIVVGGHAGAACSGSPSSSFATINGVVTHC